MKKDKIRLVGPQMAIRRSGDVDTVGVLAPMKEGRPLPPDCELVSVDADSGDADGWFDAETLYKNTSGPPQVATPRYREGYDRIFGKKEVGLA